MGGHFVAPHFYCCPPFLLLLHHEVRAAVLRPARFGVVRALRLFLAVRDDRDAPGLYALRGAPRARGCTRRCRARRSGPRSARGAAGSPSATPRWRPAPAWPPP